MRWDKLLKNSERIPLDDGKQCYGFIYMTNKKQYTFDCRDFYEKSFAFYHNDTYYKYTSYVENDKDLREIPENTVRGNTIYNIFKMKRDPETQRIEVQMCVQCDFKIMVP